MNLSMKWLRDYVDLDISPKEFSDGMTMSGSKVEGYEIEGESIEKVVVGKILSIEKHPDADKLVVCSVDVGESEPIQIVTGATNVSEGDMVPVALHGSTLPGGKKIKKGKLRGVESYGMLCSLSELKLTAHDFPYAIEDGIFILQEECRVGQDIRPVLGLDDTSVEFEITSNRPDCLSVVGLAREASATFGVPLHVKTPVVKASGGNAEDYLQVSVENTELCSRYIARVVKNVKIEPSPKWLRQRLRASGVRPINNFVDITNYVMLEYGHPMHAFDLKYVNGKKISVRNAKENEKITTLDDTERTLSPEMLVIADEKGPIAVAGVMGGEFSGIMEDTVDVVFEAACFDGISVRRTAKKLGLRTESSARFEKGLDPANCYNAVMRACELVQMLGAGEVVDGIIDADHSDKTPKTVKLEEDRINALIGVTIPKETQIQYLESLGFTIQNDVITVPSYRVDIENRADIAEEIARIYGYDKIPTTSLQGLAQSSLTPMQKFRKRVEELMLASGAYEVATYSFVSPKSFDKIRIPVQSPLRNTFKIVNPLGEETSIMRTTAIPSIMEVISRNYANRNTSGSFYEIAKVYIPVTNQEQPAELERLVLGLYGGDKNFFDLKGMVEFLLKRLRIDGCTFTLYLEYPAFHPGRCAILEKGDIKIGMLGEVHPTVLENYDMGSRAYVAELDLQFLFDLAKNDLKYKPLPKFPASSRDLSVVCDEDITAVIIEETIRKAVGSILEEVKFFDLYKGDQIPKGKKSLSYAISMRSADRTLTDEEADAAMKKAIAALEKIGAILR